MALPPFFRGVSGVRTNGKQGKCSHTCYFCIPAGCKNACWGASPNPALWDKLSRSLLSASPLLIAPVPYFCARPTGRADDRYSP